MTWSGESSVDASGLMVFTSDGSPEELIGTPGHILIWSETADVPQFTSQASLTGLLKSVTPPVVDNSIARWDGATGEIIQDSNIEISDSDEVIFPGRVLFSSGNTQLEFSPSTGLVSISGGGPDGALRVIGPVIFTQDGAIQQNEIKTGYALTVRADTPGSGLYIAAGDDEGDIALKITDEDMTFNILEVHTDDGQFVLGDTYANTLAANGSVWGIDIQHTSGPQTDFNTASGVYRIGGIPLSISNLSDVNTLGASSGNILTYDGTEWVPDVIPSDAAYANYYDTGTTNITTTATTIALDTTRLATSEFSIASDEVTVNEDGTYRFDFGISLDDTTGNDSTIDIWLEINSTEVPGTRVRAFHDNNDEESGAHSCAIISVSQSDVVRVRAQVVSGENNITTLAESARLVIHSIGSNGAVGPKGDAGATGAGSTINVSSDGSTTLNSPVDEIDFSTDFNVGEVGSAAVVSLNRKYFNAYEAGVTAITTTPTVVDVDTQRISTGAGDFTLSGGAVTVINAGVYRITYDGTGDGNSGTRTEITWTLQLNGTNVAGTTRGTYHRNTGTDINSCSATCILSLSANDTLRVVADSTSGDTTIDSASNGSQITIELIG